MKKGLGLILLIGLFTTASAAWESIGPYGGYLYEMAVCDNNNIIYAASYSNPSKIVKSTDGGMTWSPKGSVPYYTYSLAVAPSDPDVLYAGTYNMVYKSTDGGMNWSSTSFPGAYAYGIAVSPSSRSTAYVVGRLNGSPYSLQFFKTTNGGTSWSVVTLNANQGMGYCVTIDPSNANNIYAGGYYYISPDYHPCVFKSTNGGASFTEISTGITSTSYYVYSLAVHTTNPNIIYAGTYNAFYRTTNGGTSWTQTGTATYIYSLSASAANPNLAYAGCMSYVYKSTDAGATWISASSGLSGSYFRDVYAHRSSSNTAFVVNNTGFFRTTNSGSAWNASNYGMAIGSIDGFASPRPLPATIYTSYEEVAVFKSTNNGSDWNTLSTPVGCGNICAFAFNNLSSNIVYALEGYG